VAPLLVLAGVIALDLSGYFRFPALTMISPALASLLIGPTGTAIYAVVAVIGTFVLGMYHGFPGGPHDVTASTGVALGVVISGAISIVASLHRVRRETRLENITRVAEVAQHTILGAVPARMDGLALAVSYQSATADAAVGGDLYEVIDSPWGTRILVGDVRGKGLDAVRIASRVLGCFRVIAPRQRDLASVVGVLDEAVADVGGPEDFVTAMVAQIHQGQLLLVNAGHPDPLLLHDGGADFVAVPTRHPPLGFGVKGAAITTRALKPGDRLIFHTDGLTEARCPANGDFFPFLPAALAAFEHRSLDDGLADIVRWLRDWTGSSLQDDVALLAVEATGPRRGSSPVSRPTAIETPARVPDGATLIGSGPTVAAPAPWCARPGRGSPPRWRARD
jgi:serine phosphatase RsbU (regulator of sigma subunit)